MALRAAEQSQLGGAAPSPELTLLGGRSAENLVEALNRLPEGERQVVGCRFLLGFTEEETAQILEIPVATVRSRRVRALKRLRADLGVDE